MRRVVITGLGLVTPLATGVASSWERLLAGMSGARGITKFDASAMPCRVACEVERDPDVPGAFSLTEELPVKDHKRYDDFILFAVSAAMQAVSDSGFVPKTDEERDRSGVLIGSGIGGLASIEATSLLLAEKGPRRISPFFIPGSLINLAPGLVSILLGYRGPNLSAVSACSTGAHCLGDAARLIALGDADVMVAGGAEAAICPIGIGGFVACKALSTGFNETPQLASRPYDRDRDGFVMGEGAGVMVLEAYEHAKARGARIYGELVGYGLSGDAYHITAPAADGDGAYRAMAMALKKAGCAPQDVGYVNAHGTSTPMGDEIELRAVERLWGKAADGLLMSSTKSAIGHLLGAAGAVEAVFSVLAIRDGIVPPTLNLENPSVESPVNLVPKKALRKPIETVMSNSFGFGGTNASLVFRACS